MNITLVCKECKEVIYSNQHYDKLLYSKEVMFYINNGNHKSCKSVKCINCNNEDFKVYMGDE